MTWYHEHGVDRGTPRRQPERSGRVGFREGGLALGKITKWTILLLVAWLLADVSLYLFLRRFQTYHNLFYGFKVPTDQQLSRFAQVYYHPRWGWDIPRDQKGQFGERSDESGQTGGTPEVKIFGDSNVYGYGVRAEESFPGLVARQIGQSCLNYGVPAYGTDQALLKYKDISVPSAYTVLCVTDENIGRCMTVWWGFYRQDGFVGPKPRFKISRDGLELVENPARDVRLLLRMRDPAYLRSLELQDYWGGFYRSLDAPRALRWPATTTFLPHFSFFLKHAAILFEDQVHPTFESRVAARKYYHLYSADSPGLQVLALIIDDFAATARLRGEALIVVVLPLRDSVEILRRFGRSPYANLVTYLEEAGVPYVDMGPVFVREGCAACYLPRDEHLSLVGHERVASEIVKLIRALGG